MELHKLIHLHKSFSLFFFSTNNISIRIGFRINLSKLLFIYFLQLYNVNNNKKVRDHQNINERLAFTIQVNNFSLYVYTVKGS